MWHAWDRPSPPSLPTELSEPDLTRVVEILRGHAACFAFLHGSRVSGTPRPSSDLDVAAWFGAEVDLPELISRMPAGVDLVVLDTAGLELAGRVAVHGRLLFDDDPAARVAWQATTRKIYLDERPRAAQARADFVAAHRRG